MGCMALIVGIAILFGNGAPWWAYAILLAGSVLIQAMLGEDESKADVQFVYQTVSEEKVKPTPPPLPDPPPKPKPPAPPQTLQITRDTVRMIRNNLMKHHESK